MIHEVKAITYFGLQYLHKYSEEQIQSQFKDYYKFMFVRNPYDRLLSAFRNKIENPSSKNATVYKRTVRLVKEKFRSSTHRDNDTVTFEEFLEFVTFSLFHGIKTNLHFAPYKNLLNACSLKFDFIGRVETFSEDAPVIINLLFDKEIQLPQENKSKGNKSTMEYYSTVSDGVIEKIHELYKEDFTMYSYSYHDYVK